MMDDLIYLAPLVLITLLPLLISCCKKELVLDPDLTTAIECARPRSPLDYRPQAIFGTRPGENPFELKVEPQERMYLPWKKNSAVCTTVTIANVTKTLQLFKVKVTDNKFFRVQPSMGYLEPGARTEIKVAICAREEPPEEDRHFIMLLHRSVATKEKDMLKAWAGDEGADGITRLQAVFKEDPGIKKRSSCTPIDRKKKSDKSNEDKSMSDKSKSGDGKEKPRKVIFGTRPGEIPFGLQIEPDSRFYLPWKENSICSTMLSMTNVTKQLQLIKSKCTDNSLFRVQPPIAYLEPGAKIDINVSAIFAEERPKENRHFIMFLHRVVATKEGNNPKEMQKAWAGDAGADGVTRLQAVFEQQPHRKKSPRTPIEWKKKKKGGRRGSSTPSKEKTKGEKSNEDKSDTDKSKSGDDAENPRMVIFGTRPGESRFELKIEPNERLYLPWKENSMYSTKLSLTNVTTQLQLFKTKSTNDMVFQVQPTMGYLEPGANIDLEVTLQARRKRPAEYKHFIMLVHRVVTIKEKNMTKAWSGDASADGVTRIQAFFEEEPKT